MPEHRWPSPIRAASVGAGIGLFFVLAAAAVAPESRALPVLGRLLVGTAAVMAVTYWLHEAIDPWRRPVDLRRRAADGLVVALAVIVMPWAMVGDSDAHSPGRALRTVVALPVMWVVIGWLQARFDRRAGPA